MIGENWQFVTDEPVEVADCRNINDQLRGMYRVYPSLIEENRRMSTCNRMDLQTLEPRPVIMLKNLPDQWMGEAS